MSARTAAKQGRPRVKIEKHIAEDDQTDTFTPRAFRETRRGIQVGPGTDPKKHVHITICEQDWEHDCLYLNIEAQSGEDANGKTDPFCGFIATGQLDEIIQYLTIARDKAASLGFLTQRATPTRRTA